MMFQAIYRYRERIVLLLDCLMLCGILSGCADGLGTADDLPGKDDLPQKQEKQMTELPGAVSAAAYPEWAPYPDEALFYYADGSRFDGPAYDAAYDAWNEDNKEKNSLLEDYAGELDSFFTDSIRQFLGDSQGGNKVCSPINLYLAFSMLAEVTEAESRSQLLGLLGAQNVEELRMQADRVWRANYRNDGANTSILANSFWLAGDADFKQPVLDILAKDYYASAYQGTMGSEEFNRTFQNWLNEQTGGLLEERAFGMELRSDMVMVLASTVDYRARWTDEFDKNATLPGVFHGADGDVECDFMHQDIENYYWGSRFGAVGKPLQGDGSMWFILPDENVSVDELLMDDEMMAFLLGDKYTWDHSRYVTVHLSVPKFDVSSGLDLAQDMKALGVTDIFDPSVSDFTPLTDDGRMYLSKISHASRVKIDEEGCAAAAYTVMALSGTALPPEEQVDLVLDRPFIFVITGSKDMPLFVGVVNRPAD